MVVLAPIEERCRPSRGSYARPRMTGELKEIGLQVGHRRVGRPMRENGIRVERPREFPRIRKRRWGCRFRGRGCVSTRNGAIAEGIVRYPEQSIADPAAARRWAFSGPVTFFVAPGAG